MVRLFQALPKGVVAMCEDEEEWEDVGFIKLNPPITYAGYTITHVEEIDLRHVNYGTKKGGWYNDKQRSDYDADEVLEFIYLLEGLERYYSDWNGKDSEGNDYEHYDEDIPSPIERTLGIVYRVGVDIYKDEECSEGTLALITLHDRKEEWGNYGNSKKEKAKN